MASDSLSRAIENQVKKYDRQAKDAAIIEQAKIIVQGQPISNGIRILDNDSELLLKLLLDNYDGNEDYTVPLNNISFPGNMRFSHKLELEKLKMYGVLSSYLLTLSGGCVYLSSSGLSYFERKKESLTKTYTSEMHPQTRKKYDLFLSHANADKLDFVDSLYQTLSLLKINIFYDKEELSWGDNWKDRIISGTNQSEFAIIVISKEFFGREWTENELNEFLQRQNESGQKIILPLLYDISYEDVKEHYPELEYIQSIKVNEHSNEEIALLFAKELIKRYK